MSNMLLLYIRIIYFALFQQKHHVFGKKKDIRQLLVKTEGEPNSRKLEISTPSSTSTLTFQRFPFHVYSRKACVE